MSDERNDEASGGARGRGISRRALLRAGWTVPIILATTAKGIDNAAALLATGITPAHSDVHAHVDGNRHVDGTGHIDQMPHLDGYPHTDAPDPTHIDTTPHSDTMPHTDAEPHVDTLPHVDLVVHGDHDTQPLSGGLTSSTLSD